MEKSQENVHAGHRDRVRKRFLQEESFDAFQPHEVLELLLFYTIPRKDTNQLAHRILAHFHHSLPAVFEASAEELMAVEGVGEQTACLIRSILPLYRYYAIQSARQTEQTLRTAAEIKQYARSLFLDCREERLYAICLSPVGRVTRTVLLGTGSFDSVSVPAARIVQTVSAQKAASVILAHNHPFGIAAFSSEDYRYTAYAEKALAVIDVELYDHVVVSDHDACCLSEIGNVSNILKWQNNT